MSVAHAPLRSPLVWYGGKGHLARRIVPLLPPHECYLEPCAGAASVLFHKPRARLETINDLAGDVVRFYRVLRDPEQYARFRLLCELTPYAREEYDGCRGAWADADDPVERAWAWFVSVRQAFGGATGSTARHGWKYSVQTPGAALPGHWGYSATNASGTRVASAAQRYLSAVERLPEVHQRLQGVQVECGDWRRVLAAYGHAGALIYMDPPYVHETRVGDKRYAHEFTLSDHADLTAALLASPALCVLSGYRYEPIHRPLEDAGWARTDIDVPISAARHREGLRRVESVWRNPAAMEAWEQARAATAFRGHGGRQPRACLRHTTNRGAISTMDVQAQEQGMAQDTALIVEKRGYQSHQLIQAAALNARHSNALEEAFRANPTAWTADHFTDHQSYCHWCYLYGDRFSRSNDQ